MTDCKQSDYERTRNHFDELDAENQARFLIEATASSLARGVEHVGTALAEEIEDAVHRARWASSGSSASNRAAEPETAQRRRPRGEPHHRPSDDD